VFFEDQLAAIEHESRTQGATGGAFFAEPPDELITPFYLVP